MPGPRPNDPAYERVNQLWRACEQHGKSPEHELKTCDRCQRSFTECARCCLEGTHNCVLEGWPYKISWEEQQ